MRGRRRRPIVVDCRYLGHSGVGRVTEAVLEGLSEIAPPGEWVLWSRQPVDRYLWPGARWVSATGSPLRLGAQGDLFRIPRGRTVLFLHGVRPLAFWRRSIVVVYDTIPVRWRGSRAERLLWRAFFTVSARSARLVLAISDAAADQIRHDTGARRDRVRRLDIPVPTAIVDAVVRAREETEPGRVMLYAGQLKRHKNVERAVLGFAGSQFARDGGRFEIVGGDAASHDRLDAFIRRHGVSGVRHRPWVSDDELVAAFASAAFVIQPSLEEGFGLTVLEALIAGIPVCCSDIAPFREVASGATTVFDPCSVVDIARAIDEVAERAESWPRPAITRAATARSLAAQILDALAAVDPDLAVVS